MTTDTTQFYDDMVESQWEQIQRQGRALEIVKKVAGYMLNTSKLSYEVRIQDIVFEGDGISLHLTCDEYNWMRLFHTEEVLSSYGEQMIKHHIITAVRQLGEAVFLKPGAINK